MLQAMFLILLVVLVSVSAKIGNEVFQSFLLIYNNINISISLTKLIMIIIFINQYQYINTNISIPIY